jgi:transposase InsO family protein
MARPQRPNQVWVSDITYVATGAGWIYLAGVMDLCSRRIVGWACADHLQTTLVQEALRQAVNRRRPPAGLVHHSDRGCQYASQDYRRALGKIGSLASMSAAGNCYDNAAMESFWSTLKTEWLHPRKLANQREAELAIFDYIETFYNWACPEGTDRRKEGGSCSVGVCKVADGPASEDVAMQFNFNAKTGHNS